MLREVTLLESDVSFLCVHPRKMPLSLFEFRMTLYVIGNEIKRVISLQDTPPKNKNYIPKPHTSSPFLNKSDAMFHGNLAATLKLWMVVI